MTSYDLWTLSHLEEMDRLIMRGVSDQGTARSLAYRYSEDRSQPILIVENDNGMEADWEVIYPDDGYTDED